MLKNKIVKYRSRFEKDIMEALVAKGVKFEYEPFRIPYVKPPSHYTPDLILFNGTIIEIKGLFAPQDRNKHLLLKAQYPDLDIHFVFYNSKSKLNKKSNTTYAMWCEKNNFKFSEGSIPKEWLKKPKGKITYV
jgi:hypothetical protein